MKKCHEVLAIVAIAAAFLPGPAIATRTYGLEELRAAARAQHPTLESARAAVDAATALARGQRLLADPVARVESGRANGGAESGTEWRVEVGQRVPLPGRLRWQIRSAEARIEQAEYQHLGHEALLDYEVGRLWVGVLLAERAADVGARSEAIALRLAELIERRVDAGETPPVEALKARTEWFARRRLALEVGFELAASRAALDLFCNRALGREFDVSGELDSPGPLPPPETLVDRLDKASPWLLAGRIAVAGAEAELAVERRSSLPDLELSISQESELDKEATSGGIALRIPIWNRNQAAVAAADASLRESRAELDVRRLDLELELEQALLDYRAAMGHLELYEDGWSEAARRTVEIASFSYENGEGSLLELLDAQRSFLEVALDEARGRARLTIARFRIEHLLGSSLEEVVSDDNN